MKKMSLEKAARYYNGRSVCDGCPFYPNKCTDEIMKFCSDQFVKGFKQGAEYQRKKAKENKNGIH